MFISLKDKEISDRKDFYNKVDLLVEKKM